MINLFLFNFVYINNGNKLLEMNTNELLSRIIIDPEICHGKPIVRGLRYTVQSILELLASGMQHYQILADFEDLEEDDLKACLLFAAKISEVKNISKLVA
jgi:uncharacterized protein (DUF433 family)